MNKTPRDWLLARHDTATPRLDVLRRAALPPASMTLREALREIFRPHRIAWRTLACVWLMLALFHLMAKEPSPTSTLPPPSPEAAAAWIAQLKSQSHETLTQVDRPR